MHDAIVGRIKVEPIEGCDNIQLGICLGYRLTVSKDTQDGELGLFFEADLQLSEEFAKANDLVRRKTPEGEAAGGYFEENRRVKAIKMRGIKSEGFWIPLISLAFTTKDYSKLKEGDKFQEFGSSQICQKYITPAAIRALNRGAGKEGFNSLSRVSYNSMFAEHVNTDALRKSLMEIPVDSVVILTAKIHGTSHRVGHVLVSSMESPAWLDKALQKLPVGIQRVAVKVARKALSMVATKSSWKVVHGSRRVVLGERQELGGFYGRNDFRYAAVGDVNLRKGEILYGEIVGYTPDGGFIMPSHDTKKLGDKTLSKTFGDKIEYKYGQESGTCKFYVYRITQVNEDGHAVELPWVSVMGRCEKLGLTPVPEVARFIYDGDKDALLKRVDAFVQDPETGRAFPSRLDPSHIEEGVVLRYESHRGFGVLKHKATDFGLLEGYLKEKDDFVDPEEVA